MLSHLDKRVEAVVGCAGFVASGGSLSGFETLVRFRFVLPGFGHVNFTFAYAGLCKDNRFIVLHCEVAAADGELFFVSREIDLQTAGTETCDHRRVIGQYSKLATRTGSVDMHDLRCEHVLFRSNQLNVKRIGHDLLLRGFVVAEHVFNTAAHVETLLTDVVVITVQNALEGLDSIRGLDIHTGTAREGLGDVERL